MTCYWDIPCLPRLKRKRQVTCLILKWKLSKENLFISIRKNQIVTSLTRNKIKLKKLFSYRLNQTQRKHKQANLSIFKISKKWYLQIFMRRYPKIWNSTILVRWVKPTDQILTCLVSSTMDQSHYPRSLRCITSSSIKRKTTMWEIFRKMCMCLYAISMRRNVKKYFIIHTSYMPIWCHTQEKSHLCAHLAAENLSAKSGTKTNTNNWCTNGTTKSNWNATIATLNSNRRTTYCFITISITTKNNEFSQKCSLKLYF